MKKTWLTWILSLVSCLFLYGVSFATYDDFLLNLKNNGINTTALSQRRAISRYELARLLNAVDCKNCFTPHQQIIDYYTPELWKQLLQLPGNNFEDIVAPRTLFLGDNYFYCVAYVAKEGYMQGYSKNISPICSGKFCGRRNVNTAEFYQVLFNIIDEYVYSKYQANWKQIYDWYTGLDPAGYAGLYLNADDRTLITSHKDTGSRTLQSPQELHTYAKYCLFNLSACGFSSVNDISNGFWPISQINILLDNDVIVADVRISSLFTAVSGEQVLRTLYTVSGITRCEFDNDYDKDGIINELDSCPNMFNPSQRDLDGDGIGDVCDDDIDGDGVKNPIGIVDDQGNIVIEKIKKWQDNCLFVKNTDQKKTRDSIYGDACVGIDDRLGVTLVVKKVGYYAPMDAIFFAQIEGEWDRVEWDFGDGGTGMGQEINHTFLTEGVYTVQVAVSNKKYRETASTTVIVGINPDLQVAFQGIDPVLVHDGKQVKIVPRIIGDIDSISVRFGNDMKTYPADIKVIEYEFSTDGNKQITISVLKNNKIVAISSLVEGIGKDTVGANLLTDTLKPQRGNLVKFSTKIEGFSLSDVKSIVWDFGDGTMERKNTLTNTHIYAEEGPHLVQQLFTLYDGREFRTVLTLYVVDPLQTRSYYLYQALEKLFWQADKLITINYIRPDYQFPFELGARVDNGNWVRRFPKLPPSIADRYLPGKYLPSVELLLQGDVTLRAHSTFWVDGKDICLIAKLKNDFSRFKCDIDKDGIPDMCDTDIDGDGFPNPLGLIKKEPKDCKYGPRDIKIPEPDPRIAYPGVWDNCFVDANSGQEDGDEDGIGDVCDDGQNSPIPSELDTDGDGLVDSVDLCPLLPESYNRVDDTDGCPEIPDGGTNILIPAQCFSCPCNYADFADDLSSKDKLRVDLRSRDKKWLYHQSLPRNITDYF